MDARNLLRKEGERGHANQPDFPGFARLHRLSDRPPYPMHSVGPALSLLALNVSIDVSRQLPDSLVAVEANF
jgi:hypothetical protein